MKNAKQIVFVLGIIAFGIYLLIVGKSFLAPFVIAVISWYIITLLAEEYSHVSIKGKQFPKWFSLVLSFATVIFVLWGIVTIVKANINDLIAGFDTYEERFLGRIQVLYTQFGVIPPESIGELLKTIDLSGYVAEIQQFFQNSAKFFGLVFIYLLLLFLESKTFGVKFRMLVDGTALKEGFIVIGKQIRRDLSVYLKIKSFASLTTGLVSYVILSFIGVDFAAFWALLIFILNYIPTIGSIIAVLFPIAWSFVQFPSLYPFVATTVFLVLTQLTIGNIIEPRLMGKSLNLSPLVIILSLGLWGKIWGVTGMFLCVPITVIINLVLSKFPTTRPISILLSAKGYIMEEDTPHQRKNSQQPKLV